MSDALVSPAVGGVMWAATAGLSALSARRVDREGDERRVALLGVFVVYDTVTYRFVPLSPASIEPL